jgi:4-amino-4-deoxy-L-arabinose transferase-like glycosyltransferase
MVFAGLYAFGGDRAPGFSAVWTIPLLLGIAASLGRRCGLNSAAAWCVAAVLVTMPAVYNGSIGAFIDGIYAAFILAAVRIGLDAREKKHFAVFGIFCGLAMATKYPALFALPALVFCAAWRPEQRRNVRAIIPNAAVAAGVACLVALPMYLRNWVVLGSPIYPPPALVTDFLHVKYLPADAIREFYAYNGIRRGNGHGRGIIHFFTLPFNLTYHTADFSGAGGIGLAPLAFAPFGVFASWRELFARRLALVGLLLLLLWFVTMQESRYLIHFYAICSVFAVIGWRFALSLTAKRGKILCAVVLAISFAYGLFMIAKPQLSDLRAFFSPALAEQRRQTAIPCVESFDYLNHDPRVTRLLILDRSVVAYYSDKDYVKPFGQWGEQVFPDAATPAEVLPKLNELHISHILDVQSTISGFRVPPDYPGLVLVLERPGQRVYRVVPSS